MAAKRTFYLAASSSPEGVSAARLALWGLAYVVGPGGHELFTRHPFVRRVESVEELLSVLERGEA